MRSNALSGIGTKFFRWDPGTTSSGWQSIAEITSISGPTMSREIIDVTSLDSDDGYREFISAIRDGGTVSLSMNFTRDGYDLMKDDFEDDDRQNYAIVIPDTDETTLEFEGLVMELPLNIEVADKITLDVTIQISGKVVLYDGSSGASMS